MTSFPPDASLPADPAAARQAGEVLRVVLDNIPLGVFWKDRDSRYLGCNRVVAEAIGLADPAEIVGRTDADFPSVTPEQAAFFVRKDREVIESGKAQRHLIESMTLADGRTIWLNTNKVPLHDAAGRVIGVLGTWEDTTDRKRAEDEARDRNARLAAQQAALLDLGKHVSRPGDEAVRHMTAATARALGVGRVSVWRHTPDRRALRCLDLFERDADRHSTGADLSADTYPGYFRALEEADVIPAADARTDPRTREFAADYLTPLGIGALLDVPLRPFGRLEGVLCCEHVGPARAWTADEQVFAMAVGGLVSLAQERRERERAEAELRASEEARRQAAKMEAVGRLAGGVAHDFNNLLTVVSGFSELVLGDLAADDPNRDAVLAIRDAGDRAAALTRQLLAFSRKTVLEPRVLDLNALVREAERLLRRLVGDDIRVATALAPDPARVKADPAQVEQVLMNLAVNARDAMPRGGTLTVQTRAVDLGPGDRGAFPEAAPGRYVRLAVTDTGAGMPPEVAAQVFEPFFTTKGQGKGTGLGLATVYGIVRQSDGHVRVASAVGLGTTFEILLPAVDPGAPRPTAAGGPSTGRGTETILLVEDEPAVRRVARIALEGQGYRVLEAGRGADALKLLADHTDAIHLLVSDVVMPEMGGRELAEAARARRPGLRVLYMSGYTDDAVVRHGIVEATDAFLQKPFTPLTLARKVRAVLDG